MYNHADPELAPGLDDDAGEALDDAIRELRREAADRYRGRPAEWKAARFILDRLAELARDCRQTRAGERR